MAPATSATADRPTKARPGAARSASAAYFSGRNDVAVAGSSGVAINFNVDVPGETGSKLFAVASSDDGATWGTPIRLTFSANASDHGSIIGDGEAAYLVWHDDRSPGNREIYYRRTPNAGAIWDDEEQVSTNAAGDSSTPLNAITPAYAHVIWIDNRGGSYQVYYRRRELPASPVSPDAGANDVDANDGDAPDGGTAGTDGDGGCGCTSTGGGSGSLLLAPLLLALRRRRRPRAVSSRP